MKRNVINILLSISLPTDHSPTTATLFIAPSIYLPTLIHPAHSLFIHSLTLYPPVPIKHLPLTHFNHSPTHDHPAPAHSPTLAHSPINSQIHYNKIHSPIPIHSINIQSLTSLSPYSLPLFHYQPTLAHPQTH